MLLTSLCGLIIFFLLWLLGRVISNEKKIEYLSRQIQQLQQEIHQSKNVASASVRLTENQISTPIATISAETDELIESPHFPPLPEAPVIAEHAVVKEQSKQQASELQYDPQQLKDYQQSTSILQTTLDWFKGGNSIVRIAVVILLIGVVLLLRFATEYWEISLPIKMFGIALAGAVVTGFGFTLRHKRFDFAISLQGMGLAIIFLVLFSSFYLNALTSVMTAYLALGGLLAVTLWLALKQNALILAFIALISGFVAPFLLSSGQQDVPTLMGYLFILNFALAVISWFKPWRILNAAALLLTFVIVWLAIDKALVAEQYFAMACGIWAIFALYLFISIRYTQHIAPIHQHIKTIPMVDSTLIFATPFMAFSLYANLVESQGYSLSIASAILALVYFAVGYFIHRKFNLLSVLSQCFYGLGFVFLALIIPFALDAYWMSVGWAIHGSAMLYLGWRYQLKFAQYFAVVLLWASGLASAVAGIFDEQSVLFAALVLMFAYAGAYYFFRFAPKEGEHLPKYGLSNVFLLLSFIASAVFYTDVLNRLEIAYQYPTVGMLIWSLILGLVWWFKSRTWSLHWCKANVVLLAITAIYGLTYKLIGCDLLELDVILKPEFAISAVLWLILFTVSYYYAVAQGVSPLLQQIYKGLMSLCLLMLGVFASLWSSDTSIYYLTALLPVLLLAASLYLTPVKYLQALWVKNPLVIAIGMIWLVWVSKVSLGLWSMSYFMLLNPVDIVSILAFACIVFATKPYILSADRGVQVFNGSLLLVVGLLLISSIMLRMLHHYMGLPYWSAEAWGNNQVQMSLTILWAAVALVLTLLASKKAIRSMWMIGIAVLAVVIAKLIFLDLSHSDTITRIVSFIGSGVMMLVIGYFAPLPPKQDVIKIEKTEA